MLFKPRSGIKAHASHRQGFTLTELLVVMAIITVMATLSYAALRGYAARQSFNQFVQEVILSINEQRHKTITASANSVYGVYVGTSSLVYFVGPTYSAGAASNLVTTLPPGMSATSSFAGGNWHISFARLTGEPTATGTITFFSAAENRYATVTVSALGLVQ